MTVVWENPAQNMGTKIEGEYFTSEPLEAYYFVGSPEMGVGDDTNIKFVCIDRLPDMLAINEETKVIEGWITELDNWYPGFEKSEPFTYDTNDTAGGNYATYGSGLARVVTINFTIRAYNDLIYDPENPTIDSYADRIFSLTVENNYSSDRDSFIRDYFEGQTLHYEGEDLTPDEYIIKLKEDGYYD